MSSPALSGGVRQRLNWAIREGLVIAGILVFWLVVGLVLIAILGLIASLIRTLQLEPLRFVYRVAERNAFAWSVVTPLASATTGLYVLARVGTVLIDRYKSPHDE